LQRFAVDITLGRTMLSRSFAFLLRVALSVVWIGLGFYLYQYRLALGEALGGVQYFAHMGQAIPAFALLALAFGCGCVATCVVTNAAAGRRSATVMGWAGLVFASAQLLPLPGLHFFAGYVRPFGFIGEYALFLVPLVALITIMEARSRIPAEAKLPAGNSDHAA